MNDGVNTSQRDIEPLALRQVVDNQRPLRVRRRGSTKQVDIMSPRVRHRGYA